MDSTAPINATILSVPAGERHYRVGFRDAAGSLFGWVEVEDAPDHAGAVPYALAITQAVLDDVARKQRDERTASYCVQHVKTGVERRFPRTSA